jgi:hypothetical protein
MNTWGSQGQLGGTPTGGLGNCQKWRSFHLQRPSDKSIINLYSPLPSRLHHISYEKQQEELIKCAVRTSSFSNEPQETPQINPDATLTNTIRT